MIVKTVIRDTFLKYMLSIQNKLFNLRRNLPFLPERKKIRKCSKLVYDFHYKKDYAVHIKALKQALNQGLMLKKCTE